MHFTCADSTTDDREQQIFLISISSPVCTCPFADQQLFLIIIVTIINYFYFFNYMSSCKFYHDCILAPKKRKKKYLLKPHKKNAKAMVANFSTIQKGTIVLLQSIKDKMRKKILPKRFGELQTRQYNTAYQMGENNSEWLKTQRNLNCGDLPFSKY